MQPRKGQRINLDTSSKIIMIVAVETITFPWSSVFRARFFFVSSPSHNRESPPKQSILSNQPAKLTQSNNPRKSTSSSRVQPTNSSGAQAHAKKVNGSIYCRSRSSQKQLSNRAFHDQKEPKTGNRGSI